MSSALERAIEGLSRADVDVPSALRGLLVVSRRIGAEEATAWLRSELGGYQSTEPMPTYRVVASVPIEIRFDGYGGSWQKKTLLPREVGTELGGVAQDLPLKQPVAELEAFAAADTDVQVGLPAAWLHRFRQLADQNKVPHFPMYTANEAHLTLPNTHLRGVLDRIKSAALDLALDIEQVSTAAGGADGPTVRDDPELARAVAGSITHIFASNSNITVGDNTSVASGERGTAGQTVIQVGDLTALLDAAQSLLSDDGVAALREALDRDGGVPNEETRSFLDRVRGGGLQLANGVTQNAAYDGLLVLLGMAFPGFS